MMIDDDQSIVLAKWPSAQCKPWASGEYAITIEIPVSPWLLDAMPQKYDVITEQLLGVGNTPDQAWALAAVVCSGTCAP